MMALEYSDGTADSSLIGVDVDIREDLRPEYGGWRIIATSVTRLGGNALGERAHALLIRGTDRLDVGCGSPSASTARMLEFVSSVRWQEAAK
jgi:hypothetical protein